MRTGWYSTLERLGWIQTPAISNQDNYFLHYNLYPNYHQLLRETQQREKTKLWEYMHKNSKIVVGWRDENIFEAMDVRGSKHCSAQLFTNLSKGSKVFVRSPDAQYVTCFQVEGDCKQVDHSGNNNFAIPMHIGWERDCKIIATCSISQVPSLAIEKYNIPNTIAPIRKQEVLDELNCPNSKFNPKNTWKSMWQ